MHELSMHAHIYQSYPCLCNFMWTVAMRFRSLFPIVFVSATDLKFGKDRNVSRYAVALIYHTSLEAGLKERVLGPPSSVLTVAGVPFTRHPAVSSHIHPRSTMKHRARTIISDQDDLKIRYCGNWSRVDVRGSDKSFTWTSQKGDTATILFSGTFVFTHLHIWIAIKSR